MSTNIEGGTLHSLADRRSWLISLKLKKDEKPTKEEMIELWQLQPPLKGKIMIVGKLIETPRYSQTYNNEGKGYKFSGMNHAALPIPPLVQRYLDYANRTCHEMLIRDYGDHLFNMCFLNWYPDGAHYIGYHSDDESQLFKNAKGETLVFSISLGQERTFLVQRKDKTRKEKTLSLKVSDGSVLLMGGLCQTNYKHSVPPTKVKNVKARLNLTFRIFK